ncbi:hypothetical protein [Campylobacter sp.]|uniref:hypothetical protein n=1 Tax=Campylobacter sp. TaxID=205 RepID=UPI002A7EE5C5|nr:hypothetical protein [Campylobacter sp.]MCI7076308.1 hypothetical protein [Campylobacter sp.]MCI7582182.1 hypothetical protein [Campylobacter sp.]MDY3671823.1 hypothetical protein [Campylobacter sp.]MDY4802698.1 hypothetical protein [Campylobacter sp.]
MKKNLEFHIFLPCCDLCVWFIVSYFVGGACGAVFCECLLSSSQRLQSKIS